MWLVAPLHPQLAIGTNTRLILAGSLFVVALAFDLAGLLAFRASRTTINPLAPERASTLVTGGVYRITRNPMYVGMSFILLAWGVYLSALLPFLGPIIYILYITRFQILPEERVLRQLFGERYNQYTARVRRWL
jgi:protein-S-isoprenylcysteine O-methyltransferase Ste14